MGGSPAQPIRKFTCCGTGQKAYSWKWCNIWDSIEIGIPCIDEAS